MAGRRIGTFYTPKPGRHPTLSAIKANVEGNYDRTWKGCREYLVDITLEYKDVAGSRNRAKLRARLLRLRDELIKYLEDDVSTPIAPKRKAKPPSEFTMTKDLGKWVAEDTFRSWWSREYKAVLEQPYIRSASKDRRIVQQLLEHLSPEELRQRAARFLRTQDRWIADTDRGLGILLTSINKPCVAVARGTDNASVALRQRAAEWFEGREVRGPQADVWFMALEEVGCHARPEDIEGRREVGAAAMAAAKKVLRRV